MRPPSAAQPWLERFFAIDLRALATFRIALAMLVLYDLAARSRFIEATYTDDGVLPGYLFQSVYKVLSLYAVHDGPALPAIVFPAAMLSALALLVGFRTRVATVATWALLCAIHARNFYLTDGGDNLIRALLFWSLFLPLGARFSLDGRRGRGGSHPNPLLTVASAALLLQFVYLYVSAGFSKSGPEWHELGTAIEHVLSQSYWGRPLGRELLAYPELLRLATWGTIAFEIVGPLLLFVPFATERFRLLGVVAFWGFNLGLGSTIQLNLFPWVCSTAAIPFLPAFVWNRLAPESPDGAPRGEQSHLPGPLLTAGRIVGLGIVAYLAYTAITSPGEHGKARVPDQVGIQLGVVPYWNMYRHAPAYDVSFRAIARLQDGNAVDLVALQGEPGWEELERLHEYVRFRRYLVRTTAPGQAPVMRRHYLEFLCRHWNALPDRPHAEQVTMWQVRTEIRPPGEPTPHVLGRVECPAPGA